MNRDNKTTKDEIDRVVTEVDVFCETACGLIGSFMPLGLGKHWQREHDELTFLLTEIPMRFKRAIAQAQKKGWAAKLSETKESIRAAYERALNRLNHWGMIEGLPGSVPEIFDPARAARRADRRHLAQGRSAIEGICSRNI